MGRHAQASDAQQVLRYIQGVRRSDIGIPARSRSNPLARVSRFSHRQLPRYRSEEFSGSGVNWVYYILRRNEFYLMAQFGVVDPDQGMFEAKLAGQGLPMLEVPQ